MHPLRTFVWVIAIGLVEAAGAEVVIDETPGDLATRVADRVTGPLVALHARAREQWTSPATGADGSSLTTLALVYLHGCGVARDPLRASQLLQRSTEQGDPVARLAAAWCIADGCAGAADRDAAVALLDTQSASPRAVYLKAASLREAGSRSAAQVQRIQASIDEAAARGDAQALNEKAIDAWERGAREEAIETFRRAADAGSPAARRNLDRVIVPGATAKVVSTSVAGDDPELAAWLATVPPPAPGAQIEPVEKLAAGEGAERLGRFAQSALAAREAVAARMFERDASPLIDLLAPDLRTGCAHGR